MANYINLSNAPLLPNRRVYKTSGPAAEPVSLTEAKKQVEISGSDHDAQLTILIQAAREQWEADTQRALIARTLTLKLDSFYEFNFPILPVASITSVTYYDTGNASQTLSTNIYELDAAENKFRLKVDQDFPSTYGRYDAVTVTFVAGTNADSTTVPALEKQAMLMLVANYFDVNREDMVGVDMGAATGRISAYERLVRSFQRSSYP